ncbi:hypothetical protein BDN70DRAFT_93435 [Pholiota conissans]|uniref:DUF6532 domain-containing protein n=1 Tax=Pholiota conissans TaxID=109636 RepID=A0A9P5Z0Z3_9AGAR|nr:hypothetical protein BDN70DRAFT_93435 [Pholiota conissans]
MSAQEGGHRRSARVQSQANNNSSAVTGSSASAPTAPAVRGRPNRRRGRGKGVGRDAINTQDLEDRRGPVFQPEEFRPVPSQTEHFHRPSSQPERFHPPPSQTPQQYQILGPPPIQRLLPSSDILDNVPMNLAVWSQLPLAHTSASSQSLTAIPVPPATESTNEDQIRMVGPIRNTQRQPSRKSTLPSLKHLDHHNHLQNRQASASYMARTVSTSEISSQRLGGTSMDNEARRRPRTSGSRSSSVSNARANQKVNAYPEPQKKTLGFAKEVFVSTCYVDGYVFANRSCRYWSKIQRSALEALDHANFSAACGDIAMADPVQKDGTTEQDLVNMLLATMTQRKGQMKTDARETVKNFYLQDIFQKYADMPAESLRKAIQQRISDLTMVKPEDDGSIVEDDGEHPHYMAFVDHGKDLNGNPGSFNHPCCREILGQSLYGGSNAIARKFPHKFNPYCAEIIALGFTVIIVCLHEWKDGFRTNVDITNTPYEDYYYTIINAIKDCEKDPSHGNILQVQYREWPDYGEKLFGKKRDIQDAPSGRLASSFSRSLSQNRGNAYVSEASGPLPTSSSASDHHAPLPNIPSTSSAGGFHLAQPANAPSLLSASIANYHMAPLANIPSASLSSTTYSLLPHNPASMHPSGGRDREPERPEDLSLFNFSPATGSQGWPNVPQYDSRSFHHELPSYDDVTIGMSSSHVQHQDNNTDFDNGFNADGSWN